MTNIAAHSSSPAGAGPALADLPIPSLPDIRDLIGRGLLAVERGVLERTPDGPGLLARDVPRPSARRDCQAQMIGDYAQHRAGGGNLTQSEARMIERRLAGTGIFGL